MAMDVRLLFGYAKRYIGLYVTSILSALVFALLELMVTPRWETFEFMLNDPAISKSYIADELVTPIGCLFISTVPELLIIVYFCFFGRDVLRKLHGAWLTNRPDGIPKELHLGHLSILCLVLTLSINGALTNLLKLVVSNPRPDFISRCHPEHIDSSRHSDALFNLDICRQTDKAVLFEGLKSTPSAHASFVASGLGFIFLWQNKFTLQHFTRQLWCPILALVVMVSRITDHRHHWYDVVSGCVLGLAVMYGCWRWVFTRAASGTSLTLPPPVTK